MHSCRSGWRQCSPILATTWFGNRTPDVEIVRAADRDARVVVTKDRDFLDSHVLLARPHSLLLVSTGNISNDELIGLFVANLDRVVAACEASGLVELSRVAIVVHDP